MQSFQEERQALNRAQASLRYRLRDPALPDMEEDEARALIQEMVDLQQRELDLYKREQAELLKVLSPGPGHSLLSPAGRSGPAGPGAAAGAGAGGRGPRVAVVGGHASPDGWPRGRRAAPPLTERSGVLPFQGRAFRPPFFLSMQIRILFFASYRDLLGTGEMATVSPGGHVRVRHGG